MEQIEEDWFDDLRLIESYDKKREPFSVLLQARKRYDDNLFHAEVEIHNYLNSKSNKKELLTFYKNCLKTHLEQYENNN